MKKSTKFLFKIIILLAAAGTVFTAGWMNLFVAADEYAVMISKTSGINDEVISSDSFCWKWQHVIPTNVTLVSFKSENKTFRNTISGSLPSAQIFSTHLGNGADFSYRADIDLTLSIKPQAVLELYRKGSVTSSESLNEYLKAKATLASEKLSSTYFDEKAVHTMFEASVLEDKELSRILSGAEFSDLNFVRAQFKNVRIPDYEMYLKAKDSYDTYIASLTQELKSKSSLRAEEILDDDRIISRLERFAQLTQKYPEFSDIVKSQEFSQIIDALSAKR